MKRKVSNFFIFLGSISIVCAFALFCYNYHLDQISAEHCKNIVTEFQNLVKPQDDDFSDGELFLDETKNEGIWINGALYIGVLEIPKLELVLPIHMDLSMAKLSTAPCAYEGNLDNDDLVIAAHNYRSQFGLIKSLTRGDEVTITKPTGKILQYQVESVSVIHMSETATLLDRKNWDLTLFTCDYPDADLRVMVRCNRI